MSTPSTKPNLWHGITRETIPWFPTVNHDKCIGCELCFVTCGRGVYDVHDHKAWPTRQYDCMVGCTTCANICPVQAITFPECQMVQRIEREHKILAIVRKEAATKHEKLDAQKARADAEDTFAQATSKVAMQVAGEFGEKRFLVKLEALIKDRPYDIVNLKLEVPTLKGALEKTSSHMAFEITSTQQEDVTGFLNEVRSLLRDNALVLADEKKLWPDSTRVPIKRYEIEAETNSNPLARHRRRGAGRGRETYVRTAGGRRGQIDTRRFDG